MGVERVKGLTAFANFLELCAQKMREEATRLDATAADVRAAQTKLEVYPELEPWKTPITTEVSFEDLGKAAQAKKNPEQLRGIGIYPHESVPEHERTPDNTRRRLHQLAGVVWHSLDTNARHEKLREFASEVLGQTVAHTSQLHKKDAWAVCTALEKKHDQIGAP